MTSLIKRKTGWLFPGAVLLLLSGCSDKKVIWPDTPNVTEVSIALPTAETDANRSLRHALYLFCATPGSDDYTLCDSVVPLAADTRLEMPFADLERFDYRFLFMAAPASDPAVALSTSNGTPPEVGTPWPQIRLRAVSDIVSADYYCGVTNMTGDEIFSLGVIRGELRRIVGKMDFEFYRTLTGSANDPAGVVSGDVVSVLDRVSRIEIAYSGLTREMAFAADNSLVPVETDAGALTLTIAPELADTLTLAVPQANDSLDMADAAYRGSVRIGGCYLLPSARKVRVRMTFTYYDTTPVCGLPGEKHSAACFPQRELVLNLPSERDAAGLPIEADHITVNRAGLRCDRVIDLMQATDMEAALDWE